MNSAGFCPHVRSHSMLYQGRQGSRSAHGTTGSFDNAHHFVVHNPVFNDVTCSSGDFMEKLEKHTIRGAEFDSSERDPPPRCHPGTRLRIVERAQEVFANYHHGERLLWIVGPAGVGKSAIMQTLAENTSTPSSSAILGASIFFSVNGRDDISKAIPTLAYQIAVQYYPYRQFVHDEMTNDLKLPTKSIQAQFRRFIIEPFAEHGIYRVPNPLLILIDGLDECTNKAKQSELIVLISSFSLMYSDVPLIWVIASRPEPHITATFSQPIIASCSLQQEIMIDSDETRADIERYLRDELKKIRMKYPALRIVTEWPKEHDFLKLCAASDGLFAFVSTAVKFIDDPAYGNPIIRLKQLLNVINDVPMIPSLEGHIHPMAVLDVLYGRILSQVPSDRLHETRKLLLLVLSGYSALPFICNWLSMTLDAVYGVLHHLYSVLNIPPPEAAQSGSLTPLHKSFCDYLQSFERSGIFTDFERQGTGLHIECMQRIFNEVSDERERNHSNPTSYISLIWDCHMSQGYDEQDWVQRQKDDIYACAMFTFWTHFSKGEAVPIRYWKLFDMRFCCEYGWDNMWDVIQTVFSKKRRAELLEHGILREIPIGTLDTSLSVKGTPYSEVRYRYKRLTNEDPPLDCAPADNSCVDWWRPDDRHDEHQIWEGEPKAEFTQYVLQQGQMRSPDHLVVAYKDISNFGWILYEYTDPVDERAQWEFIIPYQFPSEIGI